MKLIWKAISTVILGNFEGNFKQTAMHVYILNYQEFEIIISINYGDVFLCACYFSTSKK